MKQRVLCISLLILSFISIISIENVFAATPPASFTAKITEGSSMTEPTGSTLYGGRAYWTQEYFIQVENKKYPAYCIDPGLVEATNVVCDALNPTDYPLVYNLITDKDLMASPFIVKDIAFRTAGMASRESVNFRKTGHLDTDTVMKKNKVLLTVNWAAALKEKGFFIVGDYDEGMRIKTANFIKAKEKIQNYICDKGNGLWDFCDTRATGEEAELNDAGTSTSGKYFNVTKTGTDANPRYTISVKPGFTATEVVIKAVDKDTVVTQVSPWNGTSAVVELMANSSECTAKVMVTGIIPGASTSDDIPYMCIGNGSAQSYVAIMPGNTGDKFNIPLTACDECKEVKKTPAEKKDTSKNTSEFAEPTHLENISVNLCCESGTNSHMEEYKLDELFQSHMNTYLKVDFYTNKCQNDYYRDKDLQNKLETHVGTLSSGTEQVNTYCNIYCTETISVDIPPAITSATGKFFRLAVNPVTNQRAPYIEGTKRCRIKIDYRTLRAHYEKAVNGKISDSENANSVGSGAPYWNMANTGEIYNFNKYQHMKGMADLLNNPKPVAQRFDTTPSEVTFRKLVCKKKGKVTKGSTTYTYSNDNPCSDVSTGTCNCTIPAGKTTCECDSYEDDYRTDGKETPSSCHTTYDTYHISPASYLSASCDGTATGYCKFDYYQVKSSASFPYSKNSYNGLDIETSTTTKSDKYREYSKYNLDNSNCTSAVKTVVDKWTASGWEKTGGGTFENYKSEHRSYANQNPASAYTTYSSSASTALSNFNTSKAVATDIETIIKGCETFFDSNPEAYNLNISTNFHFLQVFLNGNRNSQGQEYTVPFGTVTCGSGCDCNSGINAHKTSLIFGTAEEKMKDISEIPTNILRAATDMDDAEAPFEKNITEDILYTAKCTFPDPTEDGQITLYPGPTFESGTEVSGSLVNTATGHKYQYALYLTTYSSNFETWWDVKGLGTSRTLSKFTQEFNRGTTCAEASTALSQGTAESLKQSTTVPFTCTLKVKDGGMRIGTCCTGVTNDLNHCCDTAANNEVFEFRVVDPKNMFPGGTFNSPNIAKNWKKEDGTYETARTYKKIHDDAVADKTYSKENMTYSFRIDTNAIRLIKKYNDTHDYDSFDTNMTCDCQTSPDESDCGTINPSGSCQSGDTWTYSCRKCKSDFLTSLSDSIGVIPGVGNTGKKIWNSVKFTSLASLRNDDKSNEYTAGVHWA